MIKMKKIKERIDDYPTFHCFVASDFLDIADYETAKRYLSRLEKSRYIRRIMHGIYDKPFFSTVMNELSTPDPNEVIKALARNFGWSISPYGDTALNLMGLTTQVPSSYYFVSNGPYRKYIVNGQEINIKHCSNKELAGLSYKNAIIVQAIKAIGKNNITNEVYNRIRFRTTKEERNILLNEARSIPVWIYSVIKKICQEESYV